MISYEINNQFFCQKISNLDTDFWIPIIKYQTKLIFSNNVYLVSSNIFSRTIFCIFVKQFSFVMSLSSFLGIIQKNKNFLQLKNCYGCETNNTCVGSEMLSITWSRRWKNIEDFFGFLRKMIFIQWEWITNMRSL